MCTNNVFEATEQGRGRLLHRGGKGILQGTSSWHIRSVHSMFLGLTIGAAPDLAPEIYQGGKLTSKFNYGNQIWQQSKQHTVK